MYELVLDTRLSLDDSPLTDIFDRAIDEFLSELDLLLVETSSLMIINTPLVLLDEENKNMLQQTDSVPAMDDEEPLDEETFIGEPQVREPQTIPDQEITFPRIVPDTNSITRHDPSPENKPTSKHTNNQPALTPQLPTPLRQQWLQRLFQFWLLRLDTHTIDEQNSEYDPGGNVERRYPLPPSNNHQCYHELTS